jgi:hypothetical protein
MGLGLFNDAVSTSEHQMRSWWKRVNQRRILYGTIIPCLKCCSDMYLNNRGKSRKTCYIRWRPCWYLNWVNVPGLNISTSYIQYNYANLLTPHPWATHQLKCDHVGNTNFRHLWTLYRLQWSKDILLTMQVEPRKVRGRGAAGRGQFQSSYRHLPSGVGL